MGGNTTSSTNMSSSKMDTTTNQHCTVEQLNDLFGSTLDFQIIKSVAESCQYDLVQSSIKLIEMHTPNDKPQGKEEKVEKSEAALPKSTSYSSAVLTESRSTSYSNGLATAASGYSTPLSSSSSCTSLATKKSRKVLDFERAINNINKGYKVLVILRGTPGSGKSFLGKKILEHTVGFDRNYQFHIMSSDDYFCQNPRGNYEYDVHKIEQAHNWNQQRTFEKVSRGFSPIIIDNTNTQMWEMKPYATMATDFGYLIEILEPDTHWCFNDKELSKRNIHGVPRQKIKDMIERYEKNITAEKLISAYNLVYSFQKPPQLRLYPPLSVVAAKPVENWTKTEQLPNGGEHIETINLMNFDDEEEENKKEFYADFNGAASSCAWSTNCNSNEKDIFVISSDEEETEPSKNDNDLYTQWGVSEHSLKSWDIVTPVRDIFNSKTYPLASSAETKIETCDNCTSIEEDYFRLVRNDAILPGTYGDTFKIVETINRDINRSTPLREPQISQKLTLDKGCMTADFYEDYENHMIELESLFPGIPKSHLNYWYNKCKGDIDWTIEFLLENKEQANLIEDEEVRNEPETKATEISMTVSVQDNSVKRKTRKSGNETSEEDKKKIKKMLESKIDIGSEHYSKHLRKVKQYKTKNNFMDDMSPSTSEIQNTKREKSRSSSSNETVTIDSDEDIDIVGVESSCDKLAIDEMIEINLGDALVSQLEQKFADPNIHCPKGFLPVVQMPVNLARQLYTFYIESVYQQMEIQEHLMDTLVKEDEDFARKLQAQEQEVLDGTKPTPAPNLKEIMTDQRNAQRVYQTEIDQWKNFSPDTLAEKLTKQKLASIFPTIPQDTLLEVLHAHDNKYTDTVETLMASTGFTADRINASIKEPPINDDVLEEMKEAQRKHSVEVYQDSDERIEAESYRQEAARYLNKRNDLYQKASQYHARGMREVAQFYSGLASLQTIYYDRANNMAATAFLDEHAKTLQDFCTLDLHYLFVKEAIPALDVFLDRNINLLRHSKTKKTEYLQIITGRGNRSRKHVSKIKPAVAARLESRNIQYEALNPGMLRIKVKHTSAVTSEL
ncbi:NEDD4-binding protein 2 [Diabrotica virgifera virgifera]|uniref:NEDD4-binding protein 2 n=1 Tax=Diabrotica virgifera virgifera TaxID=50390 RepID=A0A6P7GZF3_DIAVI|nr:NEDD4-binding protein 2 [Diabrotica virgifera virgifera]